jgi:hypothetical protein
MPENTIKLIMSILRGIGIKYYKMEHKKDLYELERIEIENIFKDESIYKNKVNKFIPSYINEKTKPYIDLLKKAIIIVEQESLCKEVTDVGISSKSTEDNPVFYLTFQDENKNIFSRNYFISKKEIEEIFRN